MTEPGAGSDLQNITTKAVREGDFYVLFGPKSLISNGGNCELIIIAAKTDPTLGARGASLLVAEVADDTPGFSSGRALKDVGQKGQDTTEAFFDELRAPESSPLVTGEGQGFVQHGSGVGSLVCGSPPSRMGCEAAGELAHKLLRWTDSDDHPTVNHQGARCAQ